MGINDTRLAKIEAAIRDLTRQQEDLFRLVGGRLKRHEGETDRRFRRPPPPYPPNQRTYRRP